VDRGEAQVVDEEWNHQWVSEFVTQYRLSMYYSSRDSKSLTAILLF